MNDPGASVMSPVRPVVDASREIVVALLLSLSENEENMLWMFPDRLNTIFVSSCYPRETIFFFFFAFCSFCSQLFDHNTFKFRVFGRGLHGLFVMVFCTIRALLWCVFIATAAWRVTSLCTLKRYFPFFSFRIAKGGTHATLTSQVAMEWRNCCIRNTWCLLCNCIFNTCWINFQCSSMSSRPFGFTLLDILVALVCLAICLSIAPPPKKNPFLLSFFTFLWTASFRQL